MIKNIWYATTAPGLEPTLQAELSYEGIEGKITKGGVIFETSPSIGAQLALEIFSANKLRMLLKKKSVQGLSDINKTLSEIKWSNILQQHTPIIVDVQTKNSRLFRKDIIRTKSERCMRSILGLPEADKLVQTIFLHIEGETLSVYIDAGGGLLHKRGWRTEQGKAPLRETYASALIIASGWTPEEPLIDPFCGSGTIPIEAARMAMEATIGCNQRYPVEDWKLDSTIIHRKGNKNTPYDIMGSDHHRPSIDLAEQHAKALSLNIKWAHTSVEECNPVEKEGIFIANPPYGKRLGNNVGSVYQNFGKLLEANSGWRAMFIAPSAKLAKLVSPRARQYCSFINGGLKVGIWCVESQK